MNSIACATDGAQGGGGTKLLVKSVCESAAKSLFWAPACVQDLSTRHDWPVKNATVDLPISLKENSKSISG